MRPNDIRAHQRKRPFVPLRVFLSDGAAYDVRHPEMMIVTRTEVYIGLDTGEDEVAERVAFVDPVHIVRIEPISGQNGNSKPRKRAGK